MQHNFYIYASITLLTYKENNTGLRIRSLKSNKALGPDEVTVEILKLIAKERPMVHLDMYNVYLIRGVFPIR